MSELVTIVSMNAQGLGDKGKRKDVINLFKSKKYSIVMLQDTHFTEAEEIYIRAQWGYESFFSSHNSQSRGVATFINNNFEFKINDILSDNEGNLLILNCNIGDKNITLINIYGPNRDNPTFYEQLQNKMTKYENSLFILGGDFNLILDPQLDCYNYININNPNARNKLLNCMIDNNLIDCWRENNLEAKEYTWFRRNPIKKARLDYFLISETLFTDIDSTKILPGYRTDHSMILIAIQFGKFKKGVSYWKFNNSLLKDLTFVTQIKETIKDVKSQYCINNLEGEINIDDIPLEQLIFNINDQLFFETLLLAIRGKAIAYSSHKKKLESKKEDALISEIEKLEKATDINYNLLDLKKEELLEIRKKKMDGVFIRSKAKWIHEGEKPTNYFCNLENRNYISKFMNSLLTTSGERINTQDSILNETKCHYERLYKMKETEDVVLQDLLANFEVPKLTEEQKNSIEGNLTYSEMLNSLKRMSNNTSPGNDGFTVEFFKFFWNDIGVFLLRSLNYAFSVGELSVTQKQGVITCIPKGNKDKSYLKNWRPISLLNVSYKIASASIAYRIKNVLSDIINEDQTGFLPGRLMASNIRLLYDILFYTEQHNIPGILLLIDFAAAFDTVSWSFISKVLEFFNFGHSIRKWTDLFYTNVESCVIVNGHMSDWFKLERGCRQGDALSPYLFILCAEILAILVRNNPRIKGIRINGIEYLTSQYADDTSLTLDGTQESLLNTMLVLKFYGRISGLNVNTDKTKVIWFGARKNSQEILCPEYNLAWGENTFTLLGVKFSTNLTDIVNINYDAKIEEINRLFITWSKRMLSPIGKIVVIKSLALAKLNHLILSIPDPPQEKINMIQNLFFRFLWKNGRDKVKRTVITQEYKAGGLKMVDFKHFSLSLKATWFRRLIHMDNKFSKLVEFTCPYIKNIYRYGTDFIKIHIRKNINPFWKDALRSYLTVASNIKISSGKQFYGTNIWYNPNIKVGGSSVCYKRWLAAGIIFVSDLLNQDGEFYNYREFNNTFNIRTNYLEFNGIVRAVKKYAQEIEIRIFPPKSFQPMIPICLSIICKDIKGCKYIYRQMVNSEEMPKSLQKWKNDLGISPDTEIFSKESIYGMAFQITKDPKLLWFQYRISQRILGTNYLLKKMNIVATDSCTFCKNAAETLIHLFWNCNISKEFFNQLRVYIENKCNVQLGEWGAKEILFGSRKLDKTQNLLLLQAKHYLYYCKVKDQVPALENFKKRISTFYKIEKYISAKSFRLQNFEKQWEKYKNLA